MEEVTLKDVLNVVLDVKQELNQRMDKMQEDMNNMKTDMNDMKIDMKVMKQDMKDVKVDIRTIRWEQSDTKDIVKLVITNLGEINKK